MNERVISIQERKYNARLYPIYKMCSWDLLFYYAISFVFLTQTKGMGIASIMFTDAMYPLFKIILQLPALTVIDKIGKRNSLIIANMCLSVTLIILIFSTGIPMVLLAYFVMSFSFAIKGVAESNLLYDSLTIKKGRGMFSKIEEKGQRNYYLLDGITSIFTGLLFVINGYIPMIISLGFTVVATALASCFKEVYKIEKSERETLVERIKEYIEQLKSAFSFIFKSKRLQAIMVFTFFFDGLIYVSYTLREGLLTNINVSPEFFALIISILTIISGFAANMHKMIHKKFRNKALTFISIIYILSYIFIGLICILNISWIIKLIMILIIYAIQYAIQSPYHILNNTYLKSFASANMRVKIATTFDLIKSISAFLMAIISSYMLTKINPELSFLIIGIIFTGIMGVVVIWMKDKVGLKAEEYRKQDIKYKG